MAGEYVQYELPGQLDPGDLRRTLAHAFKLEADARASSGVRTFYDTFDGRLHDAGLSLAHEAGRLAVLDHGHERAWTDLGTAPARLFVSDLPAGHLRDALAPIVELRALTPIARLRSRERSFRVLDDEGKTVVRLLLEEARLVAGRDGLLRPRLEAVAVRGYDKALRRVCRTLEHELGVVPADVSLLDEAVMRSGGCPGGISSKPAVRIDSAERADRVAARISRRLLEVIEANVSGTLTDLDIEFLHDFRVAVRRTRSLQRQLRRAFPAEPLAAARIEFRWLQAMTGPSRDLDVYVQEFDEFRDDVPPERRSDLDPLRALLVERRGRERRRMVRALRSARARQALAEWAALLDTIDQGRGVGGADGVDAARPVIDVAGHRIAKVYKQMVRQGKAIDDSSPPEALHELRKKGKELRYLLEFFAGLYPADVVKPMVRTLKALQDTLGTHQDREVQAEMIRSLGDDVRALGDSAATLLAMGQLVERLRAQQDAARGEFAQRFEAFASRRQRALVRETFV